MSLLSELSFRFLEWLSDRYVLHLDNVLLFQTIDDTYVLCVDKVLLFLASKRDIYVLHLDKVLLF